MTSVLVDSNILLDVLGEENIWSAWSAATIEAAGNTGRLIINPIIYGEVSVRFSSVEALDDALPAAAFSRERLPFSAAFSCRQSIPGLPATRWHKAVAAPRLPDRGSRVGVRVPIANPRRRALPHVFPATAHYRPVELTLRTQSCLPHGRETLL